MRKAKGRSVVNEGGGAFCMTLFYPAVVYPVREGMKLYREEQFGPIIPVMPFDDVEDALEYVVTSDHGQQVSIFGSNPEEIGTLVDPLVNQVCRVNINCQCQRGPGRLSFCRAQGFGRRHAVGDRRVARVLDPLDGGGEADRGERGSARCDRGGAQVQVHQHALHLLTSRIGDMRGHRTTELMRVGPVIPVIVIDDLAQAVPLAKALVAGGVRVLEVTLRTPVALRRDSRHRETTWRGRSSVSERSRARRISSKPSRPARASA